MTVWVGNAKDLIAAVHVGATGAQYTGASFCVVRLESTDADDGKFFDANDNTWQAAPVVWPSGTHTQAGQHLFALPSAASVGKDGSKIHYTFTDDLDETLATTWCDGDEHEVSGWLDDAVYISSANGAAGTTAPLGTRGAPSSNLPDARTIGDTNGVRQFIFIGDDNYTLDQDYTRWLFKGEHIASIDMNGKDLSGTTFRDLRVTGQGSPILHDCILINADFRGRYGYRCTFVGACTVGDGTNPTYMIECFAESYAGATTITLNDLVYFIRLSGACTFAGLTTGTVSLTGLEGIFTIDNTCTGGAINIAGTFALTDNSGSGCTVTLTDGALSLTGINNGGPGQYQVVIQVQDALAAPFAEVKVHVFDSTNADPRWFGETDAAGNATFNLGAGTYSVRLAKGLTSFTVPETIVVTQDETFTLIGTSFVAPTAADPGDCAVYGTIWDSEGNPWAGVQIDVRATIDPQFVGDITMGNRLGTTRTSALGEFTIDLLKEAEVRFLVADAGIDFTKTVPDAASVDIKDWT